MASTASLSKGSWAHTLWRKHHLPTTFSPGLAADIHPHRGRAVLSPAPLQKEATLPGTPGWERIFRCLGPLLPPRPCLPAVVSSLPALLNQMNKNKSLCGPRKALGKRTETKGKDGGRDNNCKKWERREIQETDKINHPGIQ